MNEYGFPTRIGSIVSHQDFELTVVCIPRIEDHKFIDWIAMYDTV